MAISAIINKDIRGVYRFIKFIPSTTDLYHQQQIEPKKWKYYLLDFIL